MLLMHNQHFYTRAYVLVQCPYSHFLFMRILFVATALLLLMIGCKNQPVKPTYFGDNTFTYCKMVKQLNGVVKENNFTPIVASRNYAYANIAAYECIAAGYPKEYNSLAGQINGLQQMPKADSIKKVDYEFASLLAFCKVGEAVTFPEGSMKEYVDSLKGFAKDVLFKETNHSYSVSAKPKTYLSVCNKTGVIL